MKFVSAVELATMTSIFRPTYLKNPLLEVTFYLLLALYYDSLYIS
jgi:hypothetical protein